MKNIFYQQAGKIVPERALFWLVLIFFLKGMILCYFLNTTKEFFPEKLKNYIVFMENDYVFFLKPVDNYFDVGEFFYLKGKPFAGRMPGYSIPYYLLRLVFSKSIALQALMLMQFIFTVISTYCLAMLSYKLFRKDKFIFVITLLIYCASPYYARFDFSTLTESLSISLFIIFLYFFHEGLSSKKREGLSMAGICITWAIFLRPFLGYLLIPASLILLYDSYKIQSHLRFSIFKNALLFCLPFIVCETAWVVRNHTLFNRFIPLETSVLESYGSMYHMSGLYVRKFLGKNGLDMAEFEPSSPGKWFNDCHLPEQQVRDYIWPKRIFKDMSYNADSLIALRKSYCILKSTENLGKKEYMELEKRVTGFIDRSLEEYSDIHPFDYYLVNHLRNIRRFLFNSGSSYMLLPPFSRMSYTQKMIKVYASAMYYFCYIMGVFGLILFLKNRTIYNKKTQYIGLLGLVHLVLLPILLISINVPNENRYVFTLYPILVIFVSFFMKELGKSILQKIKYKV